MSQSMIISVPENKKPERIDKFLSRQIGNLSRSQVKRLITESEVLVDGKPVRPSHIVDSGESIKVTLPRPAPIAAEPEKMPLNIIFEDESIIVLDKQAGIVVHPARGNMHGTLVNGLLHYSNTLSSVGGPFRPGIVHRLDKGTSGLLIIAKNDNVHTSISNMFMARKIKKEYTAVVWGKMPTKSGEISYSVGRNKKDRTKMTVDENGKSAVTKFTVKAELDFTSLVKLLPVTGRTHQLRVHLSHMGNQIFGDNEYGGRGRMAGMVTPERRKAAVKALDLISRQALHASRLTMVHPVTAKEVVFDSPLPDDIESVLTTLEFDKYK